MEKKRRQITPDEIAAFIEGHDPQERIVNFDYKYNDDHITIIYRDENDNKCTHIEPFYPFVWATKEACTKLKEKCEGKLSPLMKKAGLWVKALDVTNNDGEVVKEILDGYTYMFYATKPMSYSKFQKFFKDNGCPISTKNKDGRLETNTAHYLTTPPIEQYMIASGKRMFKGYDDYDKTLRMIFDLETTGLNTEKDRIEQFGIRFNRDVKYKGKYITFNKTYRTEGTTEEEKNASELKNIDTFLRIIYTFKPDIITAHNGESFDWNIIIGACKRCGTTLEDMSRKYFDGDSITKAKNETILKLGGEIETYRKTIVPHITVTDSLHAVRRAQAQDSNMLFSNLKYVTQYSNIAKPDRVYVPGDKISEIWNSDKRFMFNEEDGDWYIYDPDYVYPVLRPDKDISYFQRQLDDDRLMAMTGHSLPQYVETDTAEGLYQKYLKDIETENKNYIYKKGKDGNKFTLYKKNVILDGYTEVSGKYIVNRYLLDDLWECDKVEYRYNSANFLVCKMIPVPFQKCCTMGTAGQWKSLMMAWSYENELAIPMLGKKRPFTGGLSRLLKVGYVPNVVKFDYNSLYPSIILTWAIQTPKDLMGAMLAFLEHVLTQREKYKGLKKKYGKEKNRLKEEALLCNDIDKIAEYKKLIMAAAEAETANDKKQLPLKIFGNSFFGSFGAPNVFPWGDLACAERVTCTGRMALRLMISHFSTIGEKYRDMINDGNPDDYNYTPIVGDSFTPDTPLFIKYDDSGMIDIVPVEKLIDEGKIEVDGLGREYDYSEKPVKILCRSGWVKPSYIYRHKTDKDIYEVSDDNGMCIDVTEDHSLFNNKKEKIKPSEINNETKIEYYNGLIESDNIVDTIPESDYIKFAISCAEGRMDHIPSGVLNSSKDKMLLFYNTFMKHYRDDVKYTKTILAGLQFLKFSK